MKKRFIFIYAVLLVGSALGGWFSHKEVRQETVTPEQAVIVEVFTNKTVSDEVRREATPPPIVSKEVVSDSGKAVCEGASATDFLCWDALFRVMVKNEGVPAAFERLRSEYETNAYARAQCHPMAHVIGRAAVALFPDVSEAYQHGDSFCWSGYYHGVMEGILSDIGKDAVTEKINGVCADFARERKYSFDHYNCVHGLGHGVMVLTNNELFDALALCDKINDAWERSSCVSGVFMENVIIDNKNHFTKYLKPEDPLYPCTAVKQEHKGICWLMQTSYMLKVSGMDFARVFDLCATVEPDFVHVCYQSLGRDASGQSLSNAEKTKAICDLGNDGAQKSNCIIGAVKDFISYHHSDTEAKRFCGLYTAEPELQSVCFSTTESYVQVL